MITSRSYIEKNGKLFFSYYFIGVSGKEVQGEKIAQSTKEVHAHIKCLCRDFILIQLEENGFDTSKMHRMDLGSFLVHLEFLRASIITNVSRSQDVFRAIEWLQLIINKLQ